ncbi:hypothetical protein XU18_2088 [Perkinsela sp. CCAP 1560/4]|nr:hypothetical protein XU18_2088 [Perkinsela sp. CCAP 1560/4]|eukprot:KNH07225.1 hypothetical protein XU18_2088 [Perkinsela sp. CCAP 1560/4]
MRFQLLLFSTVDSSLGRVDHESLSHQALMEMVIGEITDKVKICGDIDEPKDIEEWEGVAIEDGEVVEIIWRDCWLTGLLCVEWLPSSVKELAVSGNRLAGTLDWALPTSMKELDLSANKLTNPTKGHLSVVGWTSTPVLGEAKNLFKPLVVFLSWRRPY